MKNNRYLAIDPSGSGTTGVFFYDSITGEEEFRFFWSKDWKEHFIFLKNFCEEKLPTYLIYESTNFIKVRGYDLTSLFKIFGMIEAIAHFLPSIEQCEKVLVREVKAAFKNIKEGKLAIEELTFKPGRGGGWFRKGKKLEIHEVDAFLVFHSHLKKHSLDTE